MLRIEFESFWRVKWATEFSPYLVLLKYSPKCSELNLGAFGEYFKHSVVGLMWKFKICFQILPPTRPATANADGARDDRGRLGPSLAVIRNYQRRHQYQEISIIDNYQYHYDNYDIDNYQVQPCPFSNYAT